MGAGFVIGRKTESGVKLIVGFFFRKNSVETGFDERASSWVTCFSFDEVLMWDWPLP